MRLPLAMCAASDTANREMTCPDKCSSFLTLKFGFTHGTDFFLRKYAPTPDLLKSRGEIWLLNFRVPGFRRGGEKTDGLATFFNTDFLALAEPDLDLGEVIADVPDGDGSHVDTFCPHRVVVNTPRRSLPVRRGMFPCIWI